WDRSPHDRVGSRRASRSKLVSKPPYPNSIRPDRARGNAGSWLGGRPFSIPGESQPGAMPIGIPPFLRFPVSARAAITGAEAQAERQYLEALSTVRLQSSHYTSARTLSHQDVARVRAALTTFVMAAVLAYAKHACEAARTRHLQIEQIAGLVDARIEAVVAYG